MPRAANALSRYREKRTPGATPEPFGALRTLPGAGAIYVMQQHAATHLHFDLRLEIDGVLKSWAVPKGPSANPAEKRFAAFVEDHPLDYADFEGVIPDGNYGAGSVIVWDRGTYRALNNMSKGLEAGKLLFELNGYKLKGRWTLVRMRKGAGDWLLIKEHDGLIDPATEYASTSVYSGLTVDELATPEKTVRRLARAIADLSAPAWPDGEIAAPMLAQSHEPFDRPGWLFELKLDGYRLQIERAASRVWLRTRNGIDLTAAFPELVLAAARLPQDDFLLDGEVVVHDDGGKPSFSHLQQRLSDGPEGAGIPSRLVTLYAFDLLRARGSDLRQQPLRIRKALLQKLLPTVGPLRYVDHVEDDGIRTFAAARSLGLEGVVGKRADSPYISGRSADWLKVRVQRAGDFAIAGHTPAQGNNNDIGALLLGEFRNGALTYCGRVGSGLDGNLRRRLLAELAALPPLPPLADVKGARWVQSPLVCEVAYREYTRDGHLRHPVFSRLRPDKRIEECVSRFESIELPRAPLPVAQRRTFEITNPDKVFWPEQRITKRALVDYYRAIAPWMLAYLKDRPVVLTRYPDGIAGKSFFQKDAPTFAPDWIRTEVLWSDGAEREVRYFIVDDEDGLVYLANMGTIPFHVWGSRIDALSRPDWCILDLDPKDAPFANVIAVARAIHALAEEIGLPHFLKTSGSTGLHVLIPLGRLLDHEQCRTFAELLARVIVDQVPDIATIVRNPRKREHKVYIDYLQNGHGRLLVAPFSVRPVPAAAVSMPLAWSELGSRLTPQRYHIGNAVARMQRLSGDPLLPVLDRGADLAAALARLAERSLAAQRS